MDELHPSSFADDMCVKFAKKEHSLVCSGLKRFTEILNPWAGLGWAGLGCRIIA